MKTKVTLLIISATLLLMACGQVQCSPTEMTSPPTPAVQEKIHQPQATPNPTMTAQEPDTAPITAQEQPQKENTHQEGNAPQSADTPEPAEKLVPSEDIPSETVHAKTGYIEPEPTPEPEPPPHTICTRRPTVGHRRRQRLCGHAIRCHHGHKSDTEQQRLPIPCGGASGCLAGNTGSQSKGHGGLYLPPTHGAGWRGQPCGCRIPLQRLHHRGRWQFADLRPLRRLSGAKPASV